MSLADDTLSLPDKCLLSLVGSNLCLLDDGRLLSRVERGRDSSRECSRRDFEASCIGPFLFVQVAELSIELSTCGSL